MGQTSPFLGILVKLRRLSATPPACPVRPRLSRPAVPALRRQWRRYASSVSPDRARRPARFNPRRVKRRHSDGHRATAQITVGVDFASWSSRNARHIGAVNGTCDQRRRDIGGGGTAGMNRHAVGDPRGQAAPTIARCRHTAPYCRPGKRDTAMQRAGDSGPGCRASAGPEGDIAAVIDTDFVSGGGMGPVIIAAST